MCVSFMNCGTLSLALARSPFLHLFFLALSRSLFTPFRSLFRSLVLSCSLFRYLSIARSSHFFAPPRMLAHTKSTFFYLPTFFPAHSSSLRSHPSPRQCRLHRRGCPGGRQGALGDVWLLGALAALASRPGLVPALFVGHSEETRACGVYTVSSCLLLFDFLSSRVGRVREVYCQRHPSGRVRPASLSGLAGRQ